MVLLQMFSEVPLVTRRMVGLSVALSLLVQLDFLSELSLYFNWTLSFCHGQLYRVVSSCLYFGRLDLSTGLTLLFLLRYSSNLEEFSFRNNHIHYLWFVTQGIVWLVLLAYWKSYYLLSDSFFAMLLYLWSKLNRNIVVFLFGICPIPASLLCWVIIAIKLYLKANKSALSDFLGILIAEAYYQLHQIKARHAPSLVIVPSPFITLCRMAGIKDNHDDYALVENLQEEMLGM